MAETMKDPVCGMEVNSSSEYRVETDDDTVYFCSEHCKNKFLSGADASDEEKEVIRSPERRSIKRARS